MMDEAREERAALYALGLLDLDEAAAFEREAAADEELRALADELREAAASLARTGTSGTAPPVEVRGRVLARVAAEASGGLTADRPRRRWFPWTAAAILAIGCAVLVFFLGRLVDERDRTESQVNDLTHQLVEAERRLHDEAAQAAQSRSVLAQVSYCPLQPVPAAQRTGPQAAVLWDAAQRQGRLRLSKLPPPAQGKDYQLWAVEDGHKDPVSAGIIKVGLDGDAEVEFQPQSDDKKAAVVAFALSLERAGGSPQNEGPILYLGKL